MARTTSEVAALLPWVAANDAIADEPWVKAAVAHACDGPVLPGYESGQPLFRFTDPTLPAVPLLAVLMRWEKTWMPVCDRCHEERRAGARLIVVAGLSAVGLHLCTDCHDDVQVATPGLAWEVSEEVYVDGVELPDGWEDSDG